MARTRRSAKSSLLPVEQLTGPKKTQKRRSAKSTLEASSPSTKKLTMPKIRNHRKGPKPNADSEGNSPIQTQSPKDPELAVITDTAVQSSPVPLSSLKRDVKGKKKSLKAAPGKKNNAANAGKHNAADAEEQVIDGSALTTHERNSDPVDYTIVTGGSTGSKEKPLRTPAAGLSSRRLPKPSKSSAGVKKGQGHVTNKMRRISPRVHIDKILLSYMPVEDLWLGYAIELFSNSLKINRQVEQGLMKQRTWGNVQEKDETQKSLDECLIELQKQRGVLREGIAHLDNYRAMDENVSQLMEDVV